MPLINCTGLNNVRSTFEYTVEPTENDVPRIWTFRVIPVNEPYSDFFEFAVTEIDAQTVKVTAIDKHYQAVYSAKGIPEALIAEANRILNRNIISSTNAGAAKSFSNEYRTPSATKVWIRLVEQGHAVLNPATDIYSFIP